MQQMFKFVATYSIRKIKICYLNCSYQEKSLRYEKKIFAM